MAAKRRKRVEKRSRTRHADDPMVPISPHWLRAVMADRGMTVAALLREVGGLEQTLAHLTKGEASKRTRRSRRAAIAKALNVAEELLAGEASYLPTGRQHAPDEGEHSARTWLAAQRLLTKCEKAARQDMEDQSPGSLRAGGDADALLDADESLHVLDTCMRQLMRVDAWRERLLHPMTPQGGTQHRADPASEAGALVLIQTLEHILTPWFDRAATLKYRALRVLATEYDTEQPAEGESPTAILAGLDPAPPDMGGAP